MIDIDAVRAMAMSLPEVQDRSNEHMLHFYVRGKHFAWTYLERTDPGKRRQPRLEVLAVRCAAEAKESLLESAPDKLFTTEHYNGFPAVLVRLDKVDEGELRALVTAAWQCQAPRSLVRRFDQAHEPRSPSARGER